MGVGWGGGGGMGGGAEFCVDTLSDVFLWRVCDGCTRIIGMQ